MRVERRRTRLFGGGTGTTSNRGGTGSEVEDIGTGGEITERPKRFCRPRAEMELCTCGDEGEARSVGGRATGRRVRRAALRGVGDVVPRIGQHPARGAPRRRPTHLYRSSGCAIVALPPSPFQVRRSSIDRRARSWGAAA